MSASTPQDHQAPEIPPKIVRDIAQARPEAGDFRERFAVDQPEVTEFITDQLGEEVAAEFAHRVAAALWAMYLAALDRPLQRIYEDQLSFFVPIVRELLETVTQAHPGEDFDAEWLAALPKGSQPHLMGFLIGALRASRFRMSGLEILEAATVLFAVAGALESAASMKDEPGPVEGIKKRDERSGVSENGEGTTTGGSEDFNEPTF